LLRFVIPGVELGDVVQLVDELLCLYVVRNVDVGLAAPSCCSKRRCWARCTCFSFETSTSGSVHLTSTLGSLYLRVIRNGDVRFAGLHIVHYAGVGLRAPHIGARFSTPSCHSTCGLWVSSAHVVRHGGVGLSTPLRRPICRMSGLGSPDVFEEVGPVLVPSTSRGWW